MALRTQKSEQQVRAVARRVLDRIEEAEDREKLAERALEQVDDPRVRQAIVEGATGEPDAVTRAVMAAALHSGDERLMQLAAELVVDLSDKPSGVELLEECFEFPDEDIRRRAVEALESFAEPELLQRLADALQDPADVVRRSAAGTFGIIIGTPSHELRQEMLAAFSNPEDPFSHAVINNDDVQVRRQVTQSLAFVDTDDVLPTLEKLGHDEDEEVRQETVLSLAAIGSDEATEMLKRFVLDPAYRVASSALDMLASLLGGGSSAMLEVLERALDHPLPEVRRHVVLMLNRFDASQVEGILAKAAADDDFEVSRHAGEMLRSLGLGEKIDWLQEEMEDQVAGERARTVWEAGNIGQEKGVSADQTRREDVIPYLERIVRTGTPSEKVHALNELSSLVDIGTSEAMQAALHDDDSSVRSRAADTFSYTRDAGFLVQMLRTHEDPHVRRRAAEALISNPGGPREEGRLSTTLSFTSARTEGMVLFGHFLDALEDRDPGVQQHACEAVRECARRVQLLPVRRTVAELDRLIDEEDTSVLLREDAEHTIDIIGKATYAAALADGVDRVLEWRGTIAREAHSLEWDGEAEGLTTDGLDAAATERWTDEYSLSEEQLGELRAAASGEGALIGKTARTILTGLTRDMCAVSNCVVHAARALRLIGQEGVEETLEQWAGAMATGPRLAWEGAPEGERRLRRIERTRRRAWLEARRAAESYKDDPTTDYLEELVGDDDDWLKMVGLTAAAELGREGHLDRLADLCAEHEDERAYCEPLASAALALLEAGRPEGARAARAVLDMAELDDRVDLTHGLVAVAQHDGPRALLMQEIEGHELTDLPAVCMALACRGAGAPLSSFQVPAPEGDRELRCSLLALRAMDNDAEAAAALEEMLRGEDFPAQYLSSCYLDLARVWSAVLIFSSVRDQDVPYALSLVCSRALVHRGHPAGLSWFQKAGKSVAGRPEARMMTQMGKAVEDTIPLMLKCNDVNVGRFV
jgi:HEAT repeat protein